MLKRTLLVWTVLGAGVAAGVMLTAAPASTIQAQSAAPDPAPAAPAQQVNGGLKIGLVNLMQCFDEGTYEYAKVVTNEIKKIGTDIDKKLAELEKEITDVRQQLDGLPKGGALWQDKWRKLKMLEMQYKLDTEMGKLQFRTEYSRLKLDVYNEIRRVIDIYGKDGKFDIILRVEEPQLEEDSPITVSQQINQRVVLYNAEAIDVTKDLLKLLNSEYAKKAAVRQPDPPPVEKECPECRVKTLDVKCPKCGKEIPTK